MDAPPATGAPIPESPPASGDGESYASGEDGPPNDASSSGPRSAPVDMAAFVHEATSLAQTTERRWSKALGETIDNDIKDVAARARSLLMSLGRLVVQEGEGGPVGPPWVRWRLSRFDLRGTGWSRLTAVCMISAAL